MLSTAYHSDHLLLQVFTVSRSLLEEANVKNLLWDTMIWASYRLPPKGTIQELGGRCAQIIAVTNFYVDQNYYLTRLLKKLSLAPAQ
jgi:hypothetical protein